ncbi:hypothetical protein [Nocardioides sediminis]|uniref:hypothetical protein n=1 Tax=Nocardioides sediminis TaxID=433648 RepID=UPI00131EFE35|nr:hypothetical protein [Nocardioides sediminis]
MSSPSRGPAKGRRIADKPPSRWSRGRSSGVRDERPATPAGEPRRTPPRAAAGTPAQAPRDTPREAPAETPREAAAATPPGTGRETTPAEPSRTPPEVVLPRDPLPATSSRTRSMLWVLAGVVLVAGVAALVAAAFGAGPAWIDGVGAVAVATVLSWALAARTGGRTWVTAGVALALGVTAIAVDTPVLRTGAAVMTTVTGGVLAVMLTVPAVNYWRACREVLIATVLAGVTALAAVGFEPTVTVPRFDYASLLLGLVLVFALVYRLGAGLHGLGRRGLVAVLVGAVLLVLTLAYAELLRRYGAGSVVQSVLDFVDWTTERIGAFPRPLVVLLGIPALVWGTHMRARRRQGWWVCAFGVTATIPLAQGLLDPDGSFLEAGLRAAYSLVPGLVLGYLVVRADLALTGPRGRRGRRAEEAEAHRPEPARLAEL